MTGDSTVAALLTPLAPGAIAVIGVAGPRTEAILEAILRRPSGEHAEAIPVERPAFRRLVDGDESIEDVVVARRIQNGETVAEISSHGGIRIAQRVLALLARHGAAIIEGLEFHERCSDDGDVERDVDRALLRSNSRRLTSWLLRQRALLPEHLARFSRLPPEEAAAFCRRSKAAIQMIEGLRIALVGPPNSGKSTLANRLIGKDRLITSAEPGTTRDWVSETAMIQGWPVTLTDTAGLRATTCEIEAEAIRRGGLQARSADAVVVVLDGSEGGPDLKSGLDAALGLTSPGQASLVVLNKCDLNPSGASLARASLGCESLSVSALTGDGMAALEARLAAMLGLDLLSDDLPTAMLPAHLPGNM